MKGSENQIRKTSGSAFDLRPRHFLRGQIQLGETASLTPIAEALVIITHHEVGLPTTSSALRLDQEMVERVILRRVSPLTIAE